MTATVGHAAQAAPLNRGSAPPGPRKVRRYQRQDALELVGALVSSLSLVWLLFFRVTPLHGALGFVVCWFATFLPVYWAVTRELHGPILARDRAATACLVACGLLTVGPLISIVTFVISRGAKSLRPSFFTETLQFVGPSDPATAGGAAHAIIGTLEQVGIAVILSVPLAILTAVHLNEIGGRLAPVIRFFVDAMSGVPSIVAGLFIYAVWILQLGNDFSGLAAGLSLSILMLPIVTRTAYEMLRLVPGGLREAALATGSSEWRMVLQVVLPTARVGLITAMILGVARAVGETAPVLLTAFGASVMNTNPFTAPQEDLPLFVYRLIRSSQDSQVDRAWTAAMVLLLLVLVLFVTARLLGKLAVPGNRRRRRVRARRHQGSAS